MNWSATLVADVPLPLVTVTSTVPVPAGEVAVIEVAELTVTDVPALPPNETVELAVKPVPGDGDDACHQLSGPVSGLMAVTVGSLVGELVSRTRG